tara:strand:- start:5513 stop:6028 length:516 start_codon:yes stop_codon:yes gene_type:complete
MAVDFGNGPQIKSRAIQGAKVDVVVGDTSAYASLANNPLEGLTIPSKKDEVLGQIEDGKKKGTKLDQRIKKAEADGNTSKAARLTGKKERRTQRDTEKAKRVTQRNKERLAETTRRSEKKTENFTNRRVGDDGELGTADDKRPFDLMQPFARKTPFPMKTFDKFSTIAKKL